MSQSGDFDLQWIVVDGGSAEETLSLLRSVQDPRMRWISEPDTGQSAALNKGLAMADGDILAWLNGDDVYLPGTLAAVLDAFEKHPQVQWIVGRCNIIDDSDRLIRRHISNYKNHLLEAFSVKNLLRVNMISQPAVFWRRSFGQSVGILDEKLHYTMDYDLWLRMAMRCKPMILDQELASFRVHLDSKSRGGCREQFNEGYHVACRYCDQDLLSRVVHRVNVEKIVWGYRALRWFGL